QRAKEEGLSEMDMGRSDYATPGLITFKDRWGAVRIPVNYYRRGKVSASPRSESYVSSAAKRLLGSVPDSMFCALGGLLYRHVGCIFESLVMLTLKTRGEYEMPFVWFWPHGYEGCVILTHDIETETGRDFALELADIDASFGFKSSFQIVPEERYEVSSAFL